jgi:hypothetical protein
LIRLSSWHDIGVRPFTSAMALPRRIVWAPDGHTALCTPPVEAVKSLRKARVDTAPLLKGEKVRFFLI